MAYRNLQLQGFKEPAERKDILEAHAQLVGALVDLARRHPGESVLRREARHLLSRAMWSVTEIHASRYKYDRRYISEGVKELIEDSSRRGVALSTKDLRHEHVQPRRELVNALLAAEPDQIAAILDGAEACIVMKTEDERLPRHGDGWQRYADAGIRVWDRAIGDWKQLPPPRPVAFKATKAARTVRSSQAPERQTKMQILERVKELVAEHGRFVPGNGRDDELVLRSPFKGAHWSLNFPKKGFRVELYIPNNKPLFDRLAGKGAHQAGEHQVSWERLEGKRASRIALYRSLAQSESEDVARWGYDVLCELDTALNAPAGS